MVPCMPVGRKMENIASTEKVHNFQMVNTVPNLQKSVANWFQPNVERFEIYSAHFIFLVIKSNGAINMIFWWNFENVRFCIFLLTGVHGTI